MAAEGQTSVFAKMISLFNKGRYYQIVTDMSKNVVTTTDPITGETEYRRDKILEYMQSLSEEQIEVEAIHILETNNKHHRRFPENGWNNIVTVFPENTLNFLRRFCIVNSEGVLDITDRSRERLFYLGRCVQFLLNTNAKMRLLDLLNDMQSVVSKAHELRTTLCYEWFKKHTDRLVRFKMCEKADYVYYDDHRCRCRIKIMFDY